MYYVYMLTNWNNKVLYTGVTNNLRRLLYEHQTGAVEGFTKCYHTHKLVHFEITNDIHAAISREKEIKGWTRMKKNALVETENPKWEDLSEQIWE